MVVADHLILRDLRQRLEAPKSRLNEIPDDFAADSVPGPHIPVFTPKTSAPNEAAWEGAKYWKGIQSGFRLRLTLFWFSDY